MSQDAYRCFKTYMALKRHFTQESYDIFKYNGKLNNTGFDKFETRRDKYQFSKLSKLKNPDHFMLANSLKDDNFWPGDVDNMNSHAVYVNWQKRQQSMSYMFKQDLKAMQQDYDQNLVITDTHPFLLKLVVREQVGIETMIILNKLTPFYGYWTKTLDDILWDTVRKKAEKYESFFINTVDLAKYKKYTMEYFG